MSVNPFSNLENHLQDAIYQLCAFAKTDAQRIAGAMNCLDHINAEVVQEEPAKSVIEDVLSFKEDAMIVKQDDGSESGTNLLSARQMTPSDQCEFAYGIIERYETVSGHSFEWRLLRSRENG